MMDVEESTSVSETDLILQQENEDDISVKSEDNEPKKSQLTSVSPGDDKVYDDVTMNEEDTHNLTSTLDMDDGEAGTSSLPENYKQLVRMMKRRLTKAEESMPDGVTEELFLAWRMLFDLTKGGMRTVIPPFMDKVDTVALGLWDYDLVVKRPMWLKKIFAKFESGEYGTILDVMDDFYLMLENCLRYNGPDHPISKRAMKLDVNMTQRIALLPREIRGRVLAAKAEGSGHSQTYDMKKVAQTLRIAAAARRRTSKKHDMLEKRQKRQLEEDELNVWFKELIGHEKEWQEFRAMPELPQIGHMVYLCQEALHFPEIQTHQTLLERGFYMPRESSALNKLMTVLLQSPSERVKFFKCRRGSYTYLQWNLRLRQKLARWYQKFRSVNKNMEAAGIALSIEPKFFSVCGKTNPVAKRRFHELTVYQRIWIVKSLIDQIVDTQDSVKQAIESNTAADQTEYRLGMDAQGFTYIHFPQFCGNDIRVYRCAPQPAELPILRPCVYERFTRKRGREETRHSDEDDSDTNSTPRKKGARSPSPSRSDAESVASNTGKKSRKREVLDFDDVSDTDTNMSNATDLDAASDLTSPTSRGKNSAPRGPGPELRTKLLRSKVSNQPLPFANYEDSCDSNQSFAGSIDMNNVKMDYTSDSESENEMNLRSSAFASYKNNSITDEKEIKKDNELGVVIKAEPPDETDETNENDEIEGGKNADNVVPDLVMKVEAIEENDDNETAKSNIKSRSGETAEGEKMDHSSGDSSAIIPREVRVNQNGVGDAVVGDGKVVDEDDTIYPAPMCPDHQNCLSDDDMYDPHAVPAEGDPGFYSDTYDDEAYTDVPEEFDHIYSFRAKPLVTTTHDDDDVTAEVEEEEEPEITGPDIGEFELVAMNLQELCSLVKKLEKEGSKDMTNPVKKVRLWMTPTERRKAEEELVERLKYLREELEPYKTKFNQAYNKMRDRVRRDFVDFVEPPDPVKAMLFYIKSLTNPDELDPEEPEPCEWLEQMVPTRDLLREYELVRLVNERLARTSLLDELKLPEDQKLILTDSGFSIHPEEVVNDPKFVEHFEPTIVTKCAMRVKNGMPVRPSTPVGIVSKKRCAPDVKLLGQKAELSSVNKKSIRQKFIKPRRRLPGVPQKMEVSQALYGYLDRYFHYQMPTRETGMRLIENKPKKQGRSTAQLNCGSQDSALAKYGVQMNLVHPPGWEAQNETVGRVTSVVANNEYSATVIDEFETFGDPTHGQLKSFVSLVKVGSSETSSSEVKSEPVNPRVQQKTRTERPIASKLPVLAVQPTPRESNVASASQVIRPIVSSSQPLNMVEIKVQAVPHVISTALGNIEGYLTPQGVFIPKDAVPPSGRVALAASPSTGTVVISSSGTPMIQSVTAQPIPSVNCPVTASAQSLSGVVATPATIAADSVSVIFEEVDEEVVDDDLLPSSSNQSSANLSLLAEASASQQPASSVAQSYPLNMFQTASESSATAAQPLFSPVVVSLQGQQFDVVSSCSGATIRPTLTTSVAAPSSQVMQFLPAGTSLVKLGNETYRIARAQTLPSGTAVLAQAPADVVEADTSDRGVCTQVAQQQQALIGGKLVTFVTQPIRKH